MNMEHLKTELKQLEKMLLTASVTEAQLFDTRKQEIEQLLGLHRPSDPESKRAA